MYEVVYAIPEPRNPVNPAANPISPVNFGIAVPVNIIAGLFIESIS